MAGPRTLIIGVGNADRGDDGAGLAVAEQLRERLRGHLSGHVHVIEHWGEATGLVDAMTGWDDVIIVDAASSGAKAGTYRTFEAGQKALPSDLADMSSHGFGVPQAIELARALGSLPERCRVYAIEGAAFGAGAGLSEVAAHGVADVVGDIMHALEAAHA